MAGYANAVAKIEAEVNAEVKSLDRGVAELELAQREIQENMDEMKDLQTFISEMITIDRLLQHLFKTVSSSLKRVDSSALNKKQQIAYQARMQQVVQQLHAIDTRLATISPLSPTGDEKKMLALIGHIFGKDRKIKKIVKRVKNYHEDARKRSNHIQEVAHEVIGKLRINYRDEGKTSTRERATTIREQQRTGSIFNVKFPSWGRRR